MSGMEELFRVDERGAGALWAWGKAAGWAALACAGLFLCVDAGESLGSSTPGFALSQWADKALGRAPEGEREAKALLAYASAQAGLPGLAWTRVWAADRLGAVDGKFNPVTFKMTLGPGFARAASYQQRWVVLHEAGHAAAMLTGRSAPQPLPAWGLSVGAAQAMGSSIVYRQAFAESFADVFAAAMALRLDASDPVARAEVRASLGEAIGSVSLAHDTRPALALASKRLGELSTWRGAKLLALVDAIASEGAALTVGEWGAEREALCLGGWAGWRRWALDGAHQEASEPSKMAPSGEPAGGEPLSREMGELMALTPGRAWRREQLAREQLDYENALARGELLRGWASAMERSKSSPGWGSKSLAWGFGVASKAAGERRPWGCQG